MEDFGSAAATKAALLLVIGEPVSEDHKHLIPEELAKGFRTWDVETTGVDINEEVSKVVSNASLGEEGPYGERVMSNCTGTLSIEVLIAPQTTTVKRALKNFLGAPVKYHHLIYAGHALQGTGEWILQDDTFTFGDFAATFKDPDVENALKQQEEAVLNIHCFATGDWNNASLSRRKSIENVHPEIGHVYFNAYKGSRNSQDEVETEGKPNSLLVNLAVEGDKIVDNVRSLGQTPNPCYRPATATTIDPVNLYHKVGHGSLDMYILNPVQDSKELKEFYQQWSKQSIQNSNSPQFPLSNMLSICTLLIWRPADQTENITRIFFPGNAPQHKVIEGLEKLKTLNVLKVPKCCDKELNAPKAALKKSVPSKTSTASRAPSKSAVSKVEAPKRESKVDLKSKALAPKTNKVSKEDTNNKKASKTKEKGDKPKSAVSRSPKTSPPTEVPPFSSPAQTPAAIPEPTQVMKESPPDLVQKDNNLLVDFGSAPDQQLQQQQNTAPASDTLLDLIGHSSMKAESEQLLASDPTCFMNNQSPDPLPDPNYVEHDTIREPEGQLNSGLNPKEMEDMGIYDDDLMVQRERSDDAVEADKLVSSSSDDKGFEEYEEEVQPESLPEPDLIMGSQPLQYDMPTHEFGAKLDSMKMDGDMFPTRVNVLQDDFSKESLAEEHYSKEPLAEDESDLNVGQPPMAEVESYSKEEQLMAEVESYSKEEQLMAEVESDLNVGQPPMAEAESYSKEEQLMAEVESDLNVGQPRMAEAESYSKEEQLMAEVESDLNVGQPPMAEAESYSKEELMAEVESDLNVEQPPMAEAESYSKEEQLVAEVESDLNVEQPPMAEAESYSKEEQLMAEVESDLNVGQPPMAEAESYSKELMAEVESDLNVEQPPMAEAESYSKEEQLMAEVESDLNVEQPPMAEAESYSKEEQHLSEVESDLKEESQPMPEVESYTKVEEEPIAEVEFDTKEESIAEIESDTKEEEEPLVEEKPLATEMADPVESMPEESLSPDSFEHDMDKDAYPPMDYEHERDELPEGGFEQDVHNRDFSPNADMTNSVYGNLMAQSVPSAEAFEQLQQECAEMENRMHESSSQEDFESQQETKESSPDSERSSPDYEPEEVESPAYEEESPEPVKPDEYEEDSSKHEDQERSSPEGFDDEYERDDESNEEPEQAAAHEEFDKDENKENNGPDVDAQGFDMHHSDSGTAFDEQSDDLTEKESADHIKNEDHGIYDEDSEEVASQPEDEPQMDWNEPQPEEQMDIQDDQEISKVDESEADVDSETHTASSLPAAFEKDETPQPGDKLATGCSDQDDERDDTDSIDGGTPEDEKDIDETFDSSQQATDTDKHFDPSTPHPAWSTTSNLSPLAQPFDPSGNQAFDPFGQQGANNFSGDKSHDTPGQFQEYESGFGEVQSSGAFDGKAFDPTEEWGRPMNLPSPPPLPPEVKKSNGVATKKPLTKSPSTRTDRKLADSRKPETKKTTSTLGRSPKPALDRKAGLAKTEKPEKKLSNGDADMKSKTRSTASSLDKSKSSHSTAEKKPLTKTRPSSAISAKLETKSANSTLKTETKTKLSSAKRPSTTTGSRASPASKAAPPLPPHTTFYVDLTYIPNHGDPTYSDIEFFKRIRARYYVLSALSPNPQILNALLEAKQTWEDKNLEVTVIPTYDNETLRHWMGLHRDELTDLKIDVAPSASRCTIQLQDHETSCSAYRLEF
ncbi:Microtubule-associated protein futsch [Acanthosepion pharaonis]|uniref:Microtubule-associated protein futsch n=1 Tax=Acanthosepion pharaonis TaxID=158019 RepID=A0A812D9F9_ACAPH|nr:Microtubule-associated protein futsch [Sepia pharaonis]